MDFKLHSSFQPAGDQPLAIESLTGSLSDNCKNQVLLGVTGSGKTFTMANIIEKLNKPTIIMAHNKTLAAQIYEEMKEFFPQNAVEYFVSYYDYYQPEAYIPRTDTFIEKDSSINEQIDLMRHSATRSLIERRDVIIVSSVSCIYGIGSREFYSEMIFKLKTNDKIDSKQLINRLTELQYSRNDIDFSRGSFRVKGDVLDIFPAHLADKAWRINFFGREIETISEFDPLTGKRLAYLEQIIVFANSHFITPKHVVDRAIKDIKHDLKARIAQFDQENKILEAQRIDQRTMYDIELLVETGTCRGIENYSRYFTGRSAGEPPPTLFEYLPSDALLFVDESHVTIPQIHGMYNGDQARKNNLVEHGFRLPSALDNRPLKFSEWDTFRPRTVYVSATPNIYEKEISGNNIVEQMIRPTGLLDPVCEVRPAMTQIDDLISEINITVAKGFRVLVTTLTKKMAEHLTDYLKDLGIKVEYMHSEILTIDRINIINDLRKGIFDVLIGINLLREGLDIPECGLVAILDADKEGFLRSETSLIQTIGRASRNSEGRVLLYADKMTNSINKALAETTRRREIQIAHNTKYNIIPTTIIKSIKQDFYNVGAVEDLIEIDHLDAKKLNKEIKILSKEMFDAAADLRFEKAAELRDKIHKLEKLLIKF